MRSPRPTYIPCIIAGSWFQWVTTKMITSQTSTTTDTAIAVHPMASQLSFIAVFSPFFCNSGRGNGCAPPDQTRRSLPAAPEHQQEADRPHMNRKPRNEYVKEPKSAVHTEPKPFTYQDSIPGNSSKHVNLLSLEIAVAVQAAAPISSFA